MTHVTSFAKTVCLGVIASLVLGSASPAWAQDDDPDRDPTIVDEESSSAPTGVKEVKAELEAAKLEIKEPIYGEWWFWASAVATAGAWIAFSLIPMHKKALSCNTDPTKGTIYGLGCVGDGR